MRRISVFLLVTLIVVQAQAQSSDFERSRLSQAGYYNYSEQGDITIKVHVWGAVRYSGLYEIPRGSLLSELVSLAGGPDFEERSHRSSRTVNLRLHRSDGASRVVIFQTEMKNEIVVQTEDPELSDGDVLTFEAITRQGFRWRDLFPVVSMVGTIVLIVDRLSSSS